MRHLSSILGGWAKLLHGSSKRSGKKSSAVDRGGREEVEVMARKNETILRSSGTVRSEGSDCFVSVYSRRGEKGVNQDCTIVWEQFGCQEDMILCGVFDGHGDWGHYVAKCTCDSLPSSLLCCWQEALCSKFDNPEFELSSQKTDRRFDAWRQSCLRSCALVDKELKMNRRLDAYHSGTTALTIIKQDDLVVVANVGDSRAVLATTDDDGSLTPVQLTVDFRPDIPQESERILRCNGRVFCLEDEPGVPRLWLPDRESPGLAMSRAFGDHSVKGFGLISVPEITKRSITNRDRFVVLATDGVWDVISNQEAIDIVSSTPEREKSAKKLVECAVRAWRRKRKNIALDDCSVICIFFHSSSSLRVGSS